MTTPSLTKSGLTVGPASPKHSTSSTSSLPSLLPHPSSHSKRSSDEEKEQMSLTLSPSIKPNRHRHTHTLSLTTLTSTPRSLSPSLRAINAALAGAKGQGAENHSLPSPYHLRVSAVLLQCLDHLSLVSTLLSPPSSSSSSSPPSPSLDLYTLLQQHHHLSSLFSTLHSHRSHLSGLSNRAKLLSVQSSLTSLSRHLTLTIQTMSSQLQLSVDDKGQEKKNKADLDHLILLIRRAREELNSSASYEGLWREVKEEEVKATRVKAAKDQAEKAQATITSLQTQLSGEEAAYQSTLSALQSQVASAHAALRHHRTMIGHTVRFDQQSLAARAESVARERRVRLVGLERNIGELKRRVVESVRVHQSNVTYLGWVKGGVEREYGEWSERYESEVGNDRERYGELLGKRNEEMRVLIERQREWAEDEGKRRVELLEREEMEREEREREEEGERRDRSARRIQFAWRVYWRRRKVQLKKLQKAYQKKQKQQQSA